MKRVEESWFRWLITPKHNYFSGNRGGIVIWDKPNPFFATTPERKELMRHRKLVFAALLGLFAAVPAYSQDLLDVAENGIGANRWLKGGRNTDPAMPQVIGRVTDLAGRSIKAAEVTFFCLDSDQVSKVRTNAFGYYQVSDLVDGHTYLFSIQHKRYIFLIAPDSFTVGPEPFEFNFQGELAR